MKKTDKSKNLSQERILEKKGALTYNDFVTLLFVVAFLIIDFLPYFESYEIIKPQFLYLTVLNILVGFYIFSDPSLHSIALVSIFKKSYLFKLYLAFIFLSGVSIFGAKNISLGIGSITEMLVVFTMFLNFAFLFYDRLHLIYKIAFLVGICAFFQSFTALYHFVEIASSKSISEALGSNFLKGNTGNINIFSASLLFKIPFIFIGIIYYINWKKWFLTAALMLATTSIFLNSARASLLSLIALILIFIIYYLKTNSIKISTGIQLIYIILPIVISTSIVTGVFKQSKLDARYTSATERLGQINTDDVSVNRRFISWKACVEMIKKSPVAGIGLGNFRVESIPLDLNDSLPLHAHNDFLELAAETGVLNGILYILVFVAIFFINLKRIVKSKDHKARNIAFLTLMLLIVYGIDSIFNFPFYRPTMQLCFCFLLAFTFVNAPATAENKIENNDWIYLALLVFSVIPLYYTYYGYKTSNLEYLIQTDNINFEMKGVLDGDKVINQTPKSPNVFQSSESFVEYAGIYYLREKKYDKAIKYLDSAKKINPYSGRPDFYKYLVATETGKMDSAYSYIKSAFYRRPVNENFYERAIGMAIDTRDTTEILNMYKIFSTHIKTAKNWEKTLGSLQASGYSKTNLEKFMEQGIKDFPKDSIVNQKINSISITNYIIEGQRLFAVGKHDKALQEYNKGLKIDSTNIYILQNIGFYYYNLGQTSEAIPYFIKAISSLGLNDGKTEYFLGICFLANGKKENACKYFNISKMRGYPEASPEICP